MTIQATMYSTRPNNGSGQTNITIHKIRISVISTFKYRAKPAHTPATLASCIGRDNRSWRSGRGARPVESPHSQQNLSVSFVSVPHFVQNIFVSPQSLKKTLHAPRLFRQACGEILPRMTGLDAPVADGRLLARRRCVWYASSANRMA